MKRRPKTHKYALLISLPALWALVVAPASCEPNASWPEVSNLRLESDYRAVKLRWSAEPSAPEPTGFDVRYCELTSWNIEIKCRSRELRVAKGPRHNHSVIADSVRQLEGVDGRQYEAQIFDLRALTNYTFQVRPARLEPLPGAERKQRPQSGRRLDEPQVVGGATSRVETKAFAAEATKCLADASEVVINTGRHFGGRISVEESSDPRCQLLGNQSSDQTSYTFRIEHEICGSRLTDEHRIESMILVHENKDILTHNTARFLVVCNFQHKSFTLKASVALAKVNGKLEGKPALVTAVRPWDSAGEHATAVKLGSMPGLYRARSQLAASPDANGADELEAANTIEGKVLRNPERRAKELGERAQRAPVPVQVQSKVLYVERPEPGVLRNGRRRATFSQDLLADDLEPASARGGARFQRHPERQLEMLAPPVIITNNHRVSADYLALNQSSAFRYSGARPDEIALAAPAGPRNRSRSRAGRMRAVDTSLEPTTLEPEGALNRMGDSLEPELVDLEEAGQGSNATLARNITSYLLRWSLKTLTNLAKKSLETLLPNDLDHAERESNVTLATITPPTTATTTTTGRTPTNGRLDAPAEPLMPPTSGAPATPKRRQPETEQHHSDATGRPPAEQLLDGFLTARASGRPQHVEPPAKARSRPPEVVGNRTRAPRPQPRADSDPSAAPWNEGRGDVAKAGWLLYLLAGTASVAAGLLVTVWLVVSAPRRRAEISPALSVSATNTDRAGSGGVICPGDTSSGLPPPKKFQSFRSETLSGRALLVSTPVDSPQLGQTPPPTSNNHHHHSSSSSRSTSSTSVGSAALTDENDCKNQEFLFTEHVLINTSSSQGESFA